MDKGGREKGRKEGLHKAAREEKQELIRVATIRTMSLSTASTHTSPCGVMGSMRAACEMCGPIKFGRPVRGSVNAIAGPACTPTRTLIACGSPAASQSVTFILCASFSAKSPCGDNNKERERERERERKRKREKEGARGGG